MIILSLIYQLLALADLGGVPGARPHYGTKFFHFHTHFCQKAPTSEVHAPLNRSTPPLQEILDPPLSSLLKMCCLVQVEHLYCSVAGGELTVKVTQFDTLTSSKFIQWGDNLLATTVYAEVQWNVH